MTRLSRSLFFCLLTSMVLLNSCDNSSRGLTRESCIPPVAKLAYPVVPPTPGAKELEIGPLGKWELQDYLPKFPEGERVRRIIPRSGKIWILLNGSKVYSYDVTNRTWKTYERIGDAPVVPGQLFLARDGTLWGMETVAIPGFEFQNVSLFLSRYNNDEDRFEFVLDKDGILDNFTGISTSPTVAEDEYGLLWFFGARFGDSNVGLYSFDPSTQEAKKNLSLEGGASYGGPVVDSRGNIWFFHGWEKLLFVYSPATRQAEAYFGSPVFEGRAPIGTIFIDRDNRLWVGNRGWLDIADPDKPVWYELIPSPMFLTDNGWFPALGDGLPSRYGWVVPSEMSQSSNGWLWFKARGTIRLDLEKEEWCLFTTGSSPVAEDEKGNLWIVVFGKLYKYRLEQ